MNRSKVECTSCISTSKVWSVPASAGDFDGAATECRFNPEIGTIVKRNDLDQQCFRNAAQVVADGSDRDVLVIQGG